MHANGCLSLRCSRAGSLSSADQLHRIGLTNKAAPATEEAHHPTIVRIPTARSLTTPERLYIACVFNLSFSEGIWLHVH